MYAIISPRLLHIVKKKPTLVHYAIASIGLPLAAAIGSIAHSAQKPFNFIDRIN